MGVSIFGHSGAGGKSVSNPDPARFKILRTYNGGSACAAEIEYPGCSNYEGRKILVFKFPSQRLASRVTIDPHFADSRDAPVARFAPTDQGWLLAMDLADRLGGL